MRWAAAGLLAFATTLANTTSHADAWFKLGFHGTDSRLNTGDGDWFPNYTKGECGGNARLIAGVSSAVSTWTCYWERHKVVKFRRARSFSNAW